MSTPENNTMDADTAIAPEPSAQPNKPAAKSPFGGRDVPATDRDQSINADKELDDELRTDSWTETGADVDPSPANEIDQPAPPGHAESAGRRPDHK